MPLQNRVTPDGEFIATPARGTMMGNRGGQLHDASRQIGRRRWASRRWICCVLAFKERRRRVMGPRSYTELFFLDEATALAAGHRPCFECRRDAARHFSALWAKTTGLAAHADAIDDVLHTQRIAGDGCKIVYSATLAALPAGTIVRWNTAPALWTGCELRSWTSEGYGAVMAATCDAAVDVLTPRGIVGVLAAGYQPSLHVTAA